MKRTKFMLLIWCVFALGTLEVFPQEQDGMNVAYILPYQDTVTEYARIGSDCIHTTYRVTGTTCVGVGRLSCMEYEDRDVVSESSGKCPPGY